VTDVASPPVRGGAAEDLLAVARPLSAVAAAGALAGFLVGGLGGRLAMLILRLTSDASLRGLETDDGFTIGVVSSATLFLLLATTAFGVLGGLAYLLVRPWLPARVRPWLFGSLCGLLGGALVIRPGGIDFTRLEPLGLAIGMFVALPAAYGVVIALLAERLLVRAPRFGRVRASVGGLVVIALVALTGLPLVAIPVLVVLAFALRGWAPAVVAAWSSTPVIWIGRAALAGVSLVAAVAVWTDAVKILDRT